MAIMGTSAGCQCCSAATRMRRLCCHLAAASLISLVGCATLRVTAAPSRPVSRSLSDADYFRTHYTKHEFRVPMRDGVRLHTAVYAPKDDTESYPFLLFRTPYSCQPYGEDEYPTRRLPNRGLVEEGFIFVAQDVRGTFMSEGEFVNMRPHIDRKQSKADVDESSDTYDTIEWLLKNIPNNNGKVGMWGISYPGFYAAAGMIDAHPALVAVSPQAPIADWFFDDFYHHGAFFLPHGFNFFASFGEKREGLHKDWGPRFDHGTDDGYQFFMDLGPLKNANERYLHGEIEFWNDITRHPNYDAFWQSRSILPHLHNVAPAVMTVGGWFDAEDLFGPLNIYRSIEEKNAGVFNVLVMGPWSHGGWSRTDGDRLGHVDFGGATSTFYQSDIELPFFTHYLKGRGALDLPEAYVFETGANRWRMFGDWPPGEAVAHSIYFHAGGTLSLESAPAEGVVFDEFVSDPDKPVPYSQDISIGMTKEYMTDDQRFAARRPDVLVYQTAPLEEPITLAGPIVVDLWVSTSGGDADWVAKVIDVFPPDAPDYEGISDRMHMGGYQMMVRSEVIRGRFRNSYEHPEPFVSNEPTNVEVPLQDVLHTFLPGHRIMVQIQSTWFPLVDRNPQKYVDNIFEADEDDFIKATNRVYASETYPTCLHVNVLPDDSN